MASSTCRRTLPGRERNDHKSRPGGRDDNPHAAAATEGISFIDATDAQPTGATPWGMVSACQPAGLRDSMAPSLRKRSESLAASSLQVWGQTRCLETKASMC